LSVNRTQRYDAAIIGAGQGTMVPVNPDTFGQRLEAAGFHEVVVERGRGEFRFRAVRWPGELQQTKEATP